MLVHELLGNSWGEILSPYVSDELLEEIGDKVATERTVAEVYPSRENVFRAFKITPPEKILVVMLGQDPYNNKDQATGLALDCGKFISPTMQKILEIYQEDYPDSFPGPLYDGKIEHWAEQGVFLFNTALTVRSGQPTSHSKLWSKFTSIVISVLKASYYPKAFILLGRDAKNLVSTISSPHKGFYYEHPAAASYNKRKWKGKGMFLEVNDFLQKYRGVKIDW